jgi:hypothetical protein
VAYDQAAYAPNREQLIKRRISDSELARLRVGEPERVTYGPAEIEQLTYAALDAPWHRSSSSSSSVTTNWPCDHGFPTDIMACGISVRLGA